MSCQNCGHTWTGPGYDQSIDSSCPNCGYVLNPNPTLSDMDRTMRGMPDSTQDDMSGNPLMEGVWAGMDGGWKNRMKRDESFASVKVSNIITPGPGGLHGDPRFTLEEIEKSKPGLMLNGMPLQQALQVIPYGSEDPIEILHPHPKVQQVAQQVVADGHGGVWYAMMQRAQEKARQRALMQEQQPQQQVQARVAEFYDDDNMWDDEIPNPMDYAAPDGAFILDKNGRVFKGQGQQQHHEIADTNNLQNFPQGYTLGYASTGQPNIRIDQHDSGLPPDQVSGILSRNFPNHGLPEGYDAQTNEQRWFGDQAHMVSPEKGMQHQLENQLMTPEKEYEIQQAQKSRGKPFGYYNNPWINRGGSVNKDNTNTLYFPWDQDGSKIANDLEMNHPVHPVDSGNSIPKVAQWQAILGLLGSDGAQGMLSRGLGAGLVQRSMAGGGGGAPEGNSGPGMVQPTEAVPDQYLSSIHNEILSIFRDDNYTERADGDPEDVDPHEFNDGDKDSMGQDDTEGGTDGLRPEVVQAFEEASPSLLRYYHSEESGQNDPAIQKLITILQQYDPELLDTEVPPEAQQTLDEHMPHIAMGVPGIGGMQAPQTPLMPSGNMPVNPTTQANCPHCGALIAPGSGICSQCGGALQSPQAPQQGMPIPGTNPMPQQQMGVLGHTAANQGPHSVEQVQAVIQYLQQQGQYEPGKTEMDIMANPANYADILAQVSQRQQPPAPDPDPGVPPPMPDPSQMGGQGMPAGAPQGMPMQGHIAADNVAPICPKCNSHTTETLVSDLDPGNFRCHRCGNIWNKKEVIPTKAGAGHQDIHSPVIQGAPAADQSSPDDPTQDINPGIWQTTDGQPLKVGSQYEMYSAQYDVPDLVKITAIKPDGIEYTLQGEYGLEHRTAVSRQEAQMDGLQFMSMGGDDGPEQPTDDWGQSADPAQQTDLSSPHDFPLQASWSHRLAGKKFTPMEQRDFIDEEGTARNSDKLDLTNTHYDEPSLSSIDDFFLW